MTAGILGTNSPFQMTVLPGRVSSLGPTRYHLSLLKKEVLVVAWVEGVARSAREGTSPSEGSWDHG